MKVQGGHNITGCRHCLFYDTTTTARPFDNVTPLAYCRSTNCVIWIKDSNGNSECEAAKIPAEGFGLICPLADADEVDELMKQIGYYPKDETC